MYRIIMMLFALMCAIPAFAQESLTADEVAHKVSAAMYYPGNDGVATVNMTIHQRFGSVRTREFVLVRRDVADNGDQNFLLIFKQPADVRDMGYLVNKHVDKDDQRWLYLPSLRNTRRIAPSDKRSSFASSHYYYEDVSGRHPSLDTHELVGQDASTYTLKSRPKDAGEVEFAYYTSIIDKATFLPKRVEYFDKAGKLIRSIVADKVETVQGFPTVVQSTVHDHLDDASTVLRFTKLRYNVDLPDHIFSTRSLANPPSGIFR